MDDGHVEFAHIYKDYGPKLRRWLGYRFGDGIADDAVQETFACLWEEWHQRDQIENVHGWIFVTAKFVIGHMRRGKDTYRAKGTAKIASFYNRGGESEPWDAETDMRVADAPQGVAMYVEQLRDHFANLGPVQEEVLNALADGETAKEYSDRTGRSQQAVSGALQLGRKRLREALSDDRPHAWS